MICLVAPPNIIDLPDDNEDVAPKPRKSKKVAAGRVAWQEPTATPPVRQAEDAGRASVTFAAPLSSGPPASSTAPVVPSTVQLHATELQAIAPGSSAHFFTSYPVLNNQSEAATEAIRQADMMMERVKTVHENSQAAYNASAALRANVQVSKLFDCFCSRKIFFCTISCCLCQIRAPTGRTDSTQTTGDCMEEKFSGSIS